MMSLLHFLFYVKSASSLTRLASTSDGAQKARVVGGTHQISERMASHRCHSADAGRPPAPHPSPATVA